MAGSVGASASSGGGGQSSTGGTATPSHRSSGAITVGIQRRATTRVARGTSVSSGGTNPYE